MNAESQAKINLILSLKNRVKTGMTEARKKVNSGVSEIKGRLSAMRSSHMSAFKAMRAEIPIFGRAMDLLGNPYVLIMAGAIALAGVLNKGLAEAEKFNHEFLAIKQLNLDKPEKEMEGYKKSIYDTAMATGQASTDMAKAFYDIQSATGLFGDDVAKLATKIGNFSIATGAELPDAVNQTTKAMRAFKMGVDEVDTLLEANAKTVQMGITTYDELAKVQTEYAGAAAMASQNVDTANKIFAAFTARSGNASTAANEVKTAFQGISENALKMEKAFKEAKMDVKMYDANGQMRDLNDILPEISEGFKSMTDKEIDALITKIGGPEGLRGLLGYLKTNSEDFFRVWNEYDDVAFNMEDALKNAKGDFTTLKTIVGNQFNTVMAQLGEKLLPKAAKGLDKLSDFLTKVYDNWDQIVDVFGTVIKVVGGAILVWKLWTTAQWLLNVALNANPIGLIITGIAALVTLIVIAIKRYHDFGAALLLLAGPLGLIVNMIMSIKNKWDDITDAFKNKGILHGIWEIFKALFDGILYPLQQVLKLAGKLGMGFATKWSNNIEEFRRVRMKIDTSKEKIKEEEEEGKEKDGNTTDTDTDDKKPPIPPTPDLDNEVNKITGSSKEIKNLQVNIQNLAKVDISQEQMQKMSPDELEDWFNDKMMRMVRNLERNYQ